MARWVEAVCRRLINAGVWRDMLSHETIWNAIDRLAEQYHLTPSGLARKAGLDPTSFNKSKRVGPDGRMRWPSTESIAKVLEATGARIDQFVTLIGNDHHHGNAVHDILPDGNFPPQIGTIPLLGLAQAGSGGFFDDGGFPAGQGWDLVDLPTSAKPGVYALEIQGDSMKPLYRDGDILIVEPGAPVRRGDRVVVKTCDGEVMAKVLGRQTARTVDLISINPDHPNRVLDMQDVEWIARIIWVSQ